MIGIARPPCDDGVIRAGAAHGSGCAERAKPWVLAATILGSSMVFIDGSVVNVALPAIQADLAAPVSKAQWIVNVYMLMLGALILIGGAAGDRYGRRRIFALGIGVFTVASVACGMAPGSAALIAARAAQGIGGALLVPGSLAIISAAFPPAERGRAIGTWAGASALTTAFGPVLGGWLVDVWSWRAIFFINVPLAAVVLLLVFWRVPESRNDGDEAAVDWQGAALVTFGLGAIVYALTAAADLGWSSAVVWSCLALGVAALVAFVWFESRASAPMVPLQLFRSATFSGANIITLLLYFSLGGALFLLPFNLIQVQGYSAMQAGAAFLPFTLVMGGLSRWSGGLIDHYGARLPLIIGPIVAAAGFALFAIAGVESSYWTSFFPGMLVLGLGLAVSVAPLTTSVMRAVDDRHAGAASGINNAISRIAGMLAVALLGVIAVNVFARALDERLEQMRVSPQIRDAMRQEVPKLAEARVPPQVEGTQRSEIEQALDQSFVRGFRVAMLVSAALALSSALCAALTIDGWRRGRPERGESHVFRKRR